MSDKKNIWKSIREYQDDPEVLNSKLNEFKEGVTDDFDPDDLNKVSRRKFLAILAASSAYAATACTSYRDKGEIIPYVDRPEEILPGKPTYYASTFSDEGESYGVLIKTREGRPIKIEGNPDDAVNQGKIPSKVHASILNLYDPERLQSPLYKGRKIKWDKADKEIVEQLNNSVNNGKKIAIISNPLTSPVSAKIISDFKNKYPGTVLYSSKLVNNKNRASAWEKGNESKVIPSIKWDKAKIIVALESDFLGREGNTVENRMLFAKGRDIVNTSELSKLYTFEAGMSLTGINSDERFRLKPQLQFDFVSAVIGELINKGAVNSNQISPEMISIIGKTSIQKFAESNGLNLSKLRELVSKLIENKGNSIIHAGDVLSVETHLIVNLLNELLGNQSLYNFEEGFLSEQLSDEKSLKELISDMTNNKIGAIIHLDSNPVYEFPFELKYGEALKNVELSVSLSEVPNETTAISNYILPINNWLESWGLHQTRNGVLSFQQPVISPLFDTRQMEDIILNWLNSEAEGKNDFQNYLKQVVKDSFYSTGEFAADFESFWISALHDGIVKINPESANYSSIDQSIISRPSYSSEGMTLILQNNYTFGTGKYSNNGWLQELPHPVTKVTWDNFAAIAPATAELNNLKNDDLILLQSEGKEIKLPVMIQPGMAENTIVTEFGYGRTNSGEVADQVGFNVNIILNSENISQFIFENVTISKTGETYKLASTQEHHSLDDDFVKDFHRIRKIIQDGTLEEYENNPHFLHEKKHDIFSITDSHEYKNEKWAMSIDLNKCLGCSECISSCNVENNVPVVGKDQVEMGREMQWMRIDRYYSGTPEEPIVSTQPMLCQHCDNAPCENVCPVNATNHSPDGLNQMAYNRCVGTRYCANNCPYKVRRFNFYNFRDHFADAHYDNELTYLVNNPEVTVRSRGVIEKCTFCVQNIMEVREKAIKEGRKILPDEVKTACQTACPTDAIVFGDSNNPESTVTKHREHNLSYHVLEELNVRPNVTYLAKIRNTRTEDI